MFSEFEIIINPFVETTGVCLPIAVTFVIPDLDPNGKLFDILILFLKEFFEKVNFERSQQMTKKHAKLPGVQRVISLLVITFNSVW